jgi:diketogulonate reductase-like aldo/keto reductase
VSTAILVAVSPDKLDEDLGAFEVNLEREELDYLDSLTRPRAFIQRPLYAPDRNLAFNHTVL